MNERGATPSADESSRRLFACLARPNGTRRARVALLVLGTSLSFATAAVAQSAPSDPAPYATPGGAPVPATAVTPGGAPPTSAPVAPGAPPPAPAAPPPAPAPGVPAPGATEPGGETSGPTPVGTPPSAGAATPPGATSPAATSPAGAPTQPPIVVEPPTGGVLPGSTQTLRVESALGTIAATAANPQILNVSVDQDARTVTITGRTLGTTVVTVRDDRGLTRDVPVRVAEIAGSVPDRLTVRLTGDPATTAFIAERALAAAEMSVAVKPGATLVASVDSVKVAHHLRIDDVMNVDVPIIVQGDAYFTTQGITHVRVENVAEPTVRPASLLVSDYPETLKANGMLFTADLTSAKASRFLYYHYNPKGQPDRRIVLLAENASSEPATVQFISGAGGPAANEALVGHDSTQKFLVRSIQNEGAVILVPPHTTQVLLAQPLPAGSVVSNLLQLHEISGSTLHLTLVAQDASDPVSGTVPNSVLLQGDVPHARGIYPIPEFYFDYRYDAQGPDLEMPIGQIPLPNLEKGQTLAGDYGVLQSLTIRMVNYDAHNAAQVALYANPRGGAATGTFVIDRELVQMHAVPAFARFKLRQYTLPPRTYVETEIVTMPEGGSSYPLRLEIAPDDGSVPPGQMGSPVY